MSSGLRMWSSNGTLEFDTSLSTYRIVLSILVSYSPGSSGPRTRTFAAPDCNVNNAICFLLPINNDTSQVSSNNQLECEMGTNEVYVRNFLAARPSDSVSTATMRLIVARWA